MPPRGKVVRSKSRRSKDDSGPTGLDELVSLNVEEPPSKNKEKKAKGKGKKGLFETLFQVEQTELLSRPPRATTAQPPQSAKKPEQNGKETEDIVQAAVKDFWDSTWNICVERFFVMNAPITLSDELRNCWLRVCEAEWQDRDLLGTSELKTLSTKVFASEQPPLPLAFDTWARGTIEPLPGNRRESILDPFLREVDIEGHPLLAGKFGQYGGYTSAGQYSTEESISSLEEDRRKTKAISIFIR